MKCLVVSNSPQSPTGFGQQTALFLPRIRKSGRDVVMFAFTASGAPTTTADGFLQLPRIAHPFGNDVAVAHFKNARADYAISLVDPFALDPEEYRQIPWCAWSPIDSDPIYPENLIVLKAARWIWALSKWGQNALREAGFRAAFVPHGVDSSVFAPADRAAARTTIAKATGVNLDGKFLVAFVGANKSRPARKGFYEAFSAFKAFSESHPDAVLYVHSEMSAAFNGEQLSAIAELVKLPTNKIVFVPQYPYLTGVIQPGYMASLYNAADVYLSASHTEGFGIPSMESQMTGCPVILPDNSAQTELCLTGKLVEAVPYMSLGHVIWKRPSVPALVAALEWAYEQRGNTDLRAEARKKALDFDVERVFNSYMLPALHQIEKDLG